MKKNLTLHLSIIFLGVFYFSGCASFISGTTQKLTFNSKPDGAIVKVDEKYIGRTPLTVEVKRKSELVVTFEKEGFEQSSIKMETGVNHWIWGNLLFGGLIGIVVDASTGAMIKYVKDEFFANLVPLPNFPLKSSISPKLNQAAAKFILENYKNILPELKKGEGPYLKSVLKLLKVKEENRREAIRVIGSISKTYTDVLGFSQATTNVFLPREKFPPEKQFPGALYVAKLRFSGGNISKTRIEIDGQVHQVANKEEIAVAPGKIRIKFSSPGFEQQEREVIAKSGKTVSLVAQLTPHQGALTIRGTPVGAKATIDGGTYKSTAIEETLPMENIRLPIGTYQLKVKAPDHEERNFSVTVERGKTTTVSTGLADLRVRRKHTEQLSSWRWRFWAPLATGVVFALYTFNEAQAVDESNERQDDLAVKAENASTTQEYDSYVSQIREENSNSEDHKKKSDGAFVVSAVGLILLWWLYDSPPEDLVEPGAPEILIGLGSLPTHYPLGRPTLTRRNRKNGSSLTVTWRW